MTQIRPASINREQFFHHLSGWCSVALVFAAPFSRSLYILAGLLYALCWFAEGQFKEKWTWLRSLTVTAPILTLSAIVLLWCGASAVSGNAPVQTLKVYSKLPLILMLLTTWRDDVWRLRAWNAFAAAMLFVVISTYANVVIDVPWSKTQNQGFGKDHNVFMDYVSQSLMTVTFTLIALHHARTDTSGWKRWVWVAIGMLTLSTVLFLLRARSGLVALIVVTAVWIVFSIPKKWIAWASLLTVVLLATLILASPLMRQQIMMGYHEVAHYTPFSGTSLGTRIDMWRFAALLALDNPILGTGADTYRQLAFQYFGHCNFTCEHPHNQYLFFWMEYGFLGLAAYMWLLWSVFQTALKSVHVDRIVLLAFVAILAVDSLYNAPLWYRAQSYFFFSMLALLLAPIVSSKRSPDILR